MLDAGTTDAGRPYFVMELVKGIPVTKYCDQEHLTPRERMELFIPVCQAVRANGMRSGLLLVAASIVAIGAIDVAKGAKPGGGTTPPPSVTIYFRHGGAMWKMDGAGTSSSRVPLTAAPTYGQPSYARHGGQRWFVYEDDGLHVPYPTFPNGRISLDVWASSDEGLDVLLLSQSDIEVISSPIWAPDDASITCGPSTRRDLACRVVLRAQNSPTASPPSRVKRA